MPAVLTVVHKAGGVIAREVAAENGLESAGIARVGVGRAEPGVAAAQRDVQDQVE